VTVRHIGFAHRASAGVVASVAFWLAALSLVFAASVSADDQLRAESTDDQHVATDELGHADAVEGRAAVGHPPELPNGQESPPPRDPPERPPEDRLSARWPCPWLEPDPGYDKCKRKMPWPLPDWCSGRSSWPVLKAHAVNATVTGIRDTGTFRPPIRRQDADRSTDVHEYEPSDDE
jgi:hypothetical protein